MFSPSAPSAPSLSLVTITCSWTLTAIAFLTVGLLIWSRRIVRRKLGVDDYLTIVAFWVSVALVAETTWAIVDEGVDRKLGGFSRQQRDAIIKVDISDSNIFAMWTHHTL